MLNIQWRAWNFDQLAKDFLVRIKEIESYLDVFSDEHKEKNRIAIESFRNQVLTEEDRQGRSKELATIAFALDTLGRNAQQSNLMEDNLGFLQSAHEIFRFINPLPQPSKEMHRVVNNAIRLLIACGIERIKTRELDTMALREFLNKFVVSTWGSVPQQFTLYVNEILLRELESIRLEGESDHSFYRDFIRDNLEGVLTMEVPTRLEGTLDVWIGLGEHHAPAVVRMTQRKFRRPEKLSELLPKEVWENLQASVEQGDFGEMGRILSGEEDTLTGNLRLRLNAKTEFIEPALELVFKGGPDQFFREAHELLMQGDKRALQKFRDIHFRRSTHTIAKEWYAYALTKFGGPLDIHEIIELLEDAIKSEFFRLENEWTACWNLACALQRLRDRSKESLDTLLPVLENDFHPGNAFELCLLWALEQDREEVLGKLLLRSPHFEAHLLAALFDYQNAEKVKNSDLIHGHFRRISRILSKPDYVFPDPAENLQKLDLEQLTMSFIENSLVEAGIEWFRQRLFINRERRFFGNWEYSARLNELVGDYEAAWRCLQQQWYCTWKKENLNRSTKGKVLRFILGWSEKHNFREDGLRILRSGCRTTDFSQADSEYWENRLQKTKISRDNGGKESDPVSNPRICGPVKAGPDFPEIGSLSQAESAIQTFAGIFKSVGNADDLTIKSNEAEKLITAVSLKHAKVNPQVIGALRQMINLARNFHKGVDPVQSQDIVCQMRGHLDILRENRGQVPYELSGLAEACERVLQNTSVRAKAIPHPVITTPGDLKIILNSPQSGSCSTRICARLENRANEEIRNIVVTFTSTSESLHFASQEIFLSKLAACEKCIVECPVEVAQGVEENIDVRVHVACKIGGVVSAIHAGGRMATQPFVNPIPTAERYITGRPVPPDRFDLFHGRDREVAELSAAFSGGQLLKLFFVNGIRRVGKSSLMEHFGSQLGSDVLPLLVNIETVLGSQESVSPVQFMRELIRECIIQAEKRSAQQDIPLSVPALGVFELDPPWVVFESFLKEMKKITNAKNILLCFDEMQWLVKRIADQDDPMDGGFLTWLRNKIQSHSNVLIICTGSEPYAIMRRRFEHTLWGNMAPFDVSFVDRKAMDKIATLPVETDGVKWLPETLERLWDLTEGHPWVIQAIAEKACERLNKECRRVVMPSDVDVGSDLVAQDERYAEYWWNEAENLITVQHRQIAFLILQNQPESRFGIMEPQLGELCLRAGLRNIGRLLEEMRALEVLSNTFEGKEVRWRIRGAFLERFLSILESRERQERNAYKSISLDQPLALMLDWENIKISLTRHLKKLPSEKAESLSHRLDTTELAQFLFDAASRHGIPRQRWAVANWDNASFRGDQADLRRQTRFETDMAGSSKADASDHVLRERIHEVFREHPEIMTFIIGTGDGDFKEALRTLQNQGKRIILWSTRNSINQEYKYLLVGPDPITIEWLEDIVFGPETDGN